MVIMVAGSYLNGVLLYSSVSDPYSSEYYIVSTIILLNNSKINKIKGITLSICTWKKPHYLHA
jgi:hypothetical protein